MSTLACEKYVESRTLYKVYLLQMLFMDTKYVGKLQEEWLRKEVDC